MSFSVGKIIEKRKAILNSISQKIWLHPELNFEEQYAHDLLTETLKDFGFIVQKYYLLPTAFRAEFDSGRAGPTVAVICEYDALPEIGHACGHNLIAEIGLAAGVAIKESISNDSSISGKVVVLGTPAEEGGGGKIQLIQRGAFKDIDAAIMAHPQVNNVLYPLILDLARITVTYRIKDDVDAWEDSNAMDAAVTCYNNVSILRSSFKSNWRVSVVFQRCGSEETTLSFCYRAPTRRDISIMKKKLKVCIDSAAETTDCICDCDYHEESNHSEYKGMVANETIANIFAKHAESRGIVFLDDDPCFCKSAVSTDMGNVSHVVPSIQPEYSIGAAPYVNHTPGFAKAAYAEEAQGPTLVIAESLAETAIELMSNAELMAKVKVEFENNLDINGPGFVRQAGE